MKILPKTIYVLLLLLACLAANGANKRTFTVISAAKGLADNSAQTIVCTKTGRMVISTIGNLNFYDGVNFSHIDTRKEYQYQLPQYQGNYHLYFDRLHHLWLKDTHSLVCVDLLTEQFVPNVDSVLTAIGCPMPTLDLFVDYLNDIWTLSAKGLYCVNSKKTYSVLDDLNLQDVDVFDNLLLTFYENGEVVAQDLETGKVVHRTCAYDLATARKYDHSSVLLRYKDDVFQIRNGKAGGILLRFNVNCQECTVIHQTPYHLNNMAVLDDCLYIPSEWGYWTYDIPTQKLEWQKEFTMEDGSTIETDCNALCFDRQKGMWIGTEKRGLLYARPKVSAFKTYLWSEPEAVRLTQVMEDISQNIWEFQGQRANCLYKDSRGWSWIGTTTGLYLYKTPQSTPMVFTRREGLYNNVIHSVVEDLDHNIWMATSDGISCVIFDGEEVEYVNSFSSLDNVPSESFVNCKAVCLPDGEIAMQSIDHVVVFHPSDLAELNTVRPFKLFPKLTKIMVNGNAVVPRQIVDGNMIIDRAITRVRDISVNSYQNTISLIFSPLNYYRPLQSYYHVRIKGLGHEEWKDYSYFDSEIVDNQGVLHLSLIGLQPGDYSVELQCSMFPGQWEGTPFIWNIHVNESWWRRSWLLLLFGFFVLALAIANFVLYVRNTRMRVRRSHEESDVIKKIRLFVERCQSLEGKKLSPSPDEFNVQTHQYDLSREFVEMMRKLIPYVSDHQNADLTMRSLSSVAGVDVVKFYEVIMSNIHKSPRELTRQSRLSEAAELLTGTNKSIEQIADVCGFYTPNYFIGNFFHYYKQTPAEYRQSHSS